MVPVVLKAETNSLLLPLLCGLNRRVPESLSVGLLVLMLDPATEFSTLWSREFQWSYGRVRDGGRGLIYHLKVDLSFGSHNGRPRNVGWAEELLGGKVEWSPSHNSRLCPRYEGSREPTPKVSLVVLSVLSLEVEGRGPGVSHDPECGREKGNRSFSFTTTNTSFVCRNA